MNNFFLWILLGGGVSLLAGESSFYYDSNETKAFLPYMAGNTAFFLSTRMQSRGAELRVISFEQIENSSSQITNLLAAKGLPYGSAERIAKTNTPFSLWVEGFGDFSQQKKHHQNPAFHAATWGTIFGFDFYQPYFSFMSSAVYANTHIDQKQESGEGTISSWGGSAYGTGILGDGYLELGIWGIYNRYKTDRQIYISELNQRAKTSFPGWQMMPHLGIGYDWFFTDEWLLEPFVSADCSFIWKDGFCEKGSGVLIMTQPHSISQFLETKTGIRIYYSQETISKTVLLLQMTGVYLYKKGWNLGHKQKMFFSDAQNCFAPELEFLVRKKHAFFSLSYEGVFGAQFLSNSAMIKIGGFF